MCRALCFLLVTAVLFRAFVVVTDADCYSCFILCICCCYSCFILCILLLLQLIYSVVVAAVDRDGGAVAGVHSGA